MGGRNVPYRETKTDIVARVNRKNPMYYLLNIMLFAMILIFALLVIANFFKGKIWLFLLFIGLQGFFLSLYIVIRIRDGDTIVCSDSGIKEVNWLFTRFIKWEEIVKVYFYSEGKLAKKFPWLKTCFDIAWTNIKVKGKKDIIRINTRFSHSTQLQAYIRSKCEGKIINRTYEPIYTLVIMVIAIIITGLIMWYKVNQ